jgi:hypothetical protein
MPIIKEKSKGAIGHIKKTFDDPRFGEMAEDMVHLGAAIALRVLEGAIKSGDWGKVHKEVDSLNKEIELQVFKDMFAKTKEK